jgi:type VI secretion system protein ImpA
MNALPVEQLLAPLGEDAPCGSDLEYDPAFLALEEVSRGKPEQQFGDTVIAAEEPDWRAVSEQSRALAERTRDLRVAVLLTRSGARLQGITAYAEGLSLIAGLLERYWTQVFPLLDADDNDDPTMRVNALTALSAGDAGLADLRAAVVGNGRNGFNVRQLELAGGRVQPGPNETAPTAEGVAQALAQAEAQVPGTLAALKSSNVDLLRIEAVLNEKVGSLGPDLRPLQVLTRQLLQAATQAEGSAADAAAEEAAQADSEAGGAATGGSSVAGAGALRSREDIVRTLDRVCQWIEQNEPSNPAPLLIRRAQRLMSKSFMDIIRDLAPDGLSQIEKIAGPTE